MPEGGTFAWLARSLKGQEILRLLAGERLEGTARRESAKETISKPATPTRSLRGRLRDVPPGDDVWRAHHQPGKLRLMRAYFMVPMSFLSGSGKRISAPTVGIVDFYVINVPPLASTAAAIASMSSTEKVASMPLILHALVHQSLDACLEAHGGLPQIRRRR